VSAADRTPAEQREALSIYLADVPPATDGLLVSLARAVANQREHEHPKWEDIYCANLAGWAGERMGPVLRRLIDVEAEMEQLRTTAEAYPGELAMLRGVVAVLRTVARHSDLDETEGVRELRRVIAEHYADERAAYAEAAEKDSATAPTSTPQPTSACARCRSVFDPTDTRFDGRAQYHSTQFCRCCVDLCHDNESADHACVICRPRAEGGGVR
jgi:hypothetical protein